MLSISKRFWLSGTDYSPMNRCVALPVPRTHTRNISASCVYNS